jgi:hypothetical protein
MPGIHIGGFGQHVFYGCCCWLLVLFTHPPLAFFVHKQQQLTLDSRVSLVFAISIPLPPQQMGSFGHFCPISENNKSSPAFQFTFNPFHFLDSISKYSKFPNPRSSNLKLCY